MKYVIVPDSFKGTISANEYINIAKEEILRLDDEAIISSFPIADGGEGTVTTLSQLLPLKMKTCSVFNPLQKKIQASYGIYQEKTAIIEIASASGFSLIPHSTASVLKASTYGTGQLMMDAIQNGCKHIILGLGGSATNDAGIGILKAFGVLFYDENHELFDPDISSFNKIHSIDTAALSTKIKDVTFTLYCDVTNPFCGRNGATRVFGIQKGATGPTNDFIESQMNSLQIFLSSNFHLDCQSIKGGGAAGGCGLILHLFFHATIKKGIDEILKLIHFSSIIQDADVIITGEGHVDSQTFQGKVISGILKITKKENKQLTIICGGADASLKDTKYYKILATTKSNNKYYIRKNAFILLRHTIRRYLKSIQK